MAAGVWVVVLLAFLFWMQAVPVAFGLSPSSVSRRFIRVSARQLRAAYARPTYAEAKAAPGRVRQELRLLNESAVTSLNEGVEETLTLHRLGLFPRLGVSLKTTNRLESFNALVGQRTAKIDRWRTSDQKQRWLAAALPDIEPPLRRIKGLPALPLLRTALQAEPQGTGGGKQARSGGVALTSPPQR